MFYINIRRIWFIFGKKKKLLLFNRLKQQDIDCTRGIQTEMRIFYPGQKYRQILKNYHKNFFAHLLVT